MPQPTDPSVLDAVLAAWMRHNLVLTNLLRALPPEGLGARASEGSPTVCQMFTHMHHERMVSLHEEVPEHAGPVPKQEWAAEAHPEQIADMLAQSAARVRDAVRARVEGGRALDLHFGHPVILVQFLIFHESYHHGQIKLALKAIGRPLSDDDAGPLTWDVWRTRWPSPLGGQPATA
jgi:uncharacterized damage-inducible protein DinB